MKLPFLNKRSFLKYVDSLPRGPTWACTPLKVVGDVPDGDGNMKMELLELWHRDPVEVVTDLIGNPAFKGKLAYRPQRIWCDEKRMNREYSEMWTGTWWWDTQVSKYDVALFVLE
jgi:hypothetical protein